MKKKNASAKEGDNGLMDRWWLMFTNPEKKDANDNYIPQGFAEISLELVPKMVKDERSNGNGREAPNQFPIMPEPTGRFTFVTIKSLLIYYRISFRLGK
jgi:hypothetical protein